MPHNRRNYFCQQLSSWLHETKWHFTTLLATCIDTIKEPPNDIDNLVNCLLLSFPEKPSYQTLYSYTTDSTIIENWFRRGLVKPSVKSFHLQASAPSRTVDSKLPQLHSLPDLSSWLGVSLTQLEWLTDLKRIDVYEPEKYKHYHYSLVKKRRGGMRLIESPKTQLKRVQRQIYSGLLTKISAHDAAHGFQQNRSCLTHAKNHTNQHYLFTFDLANYFHSIDWYRVYQIFYDLGYSSELAKYLSGLCTNKFNGHKSILMKLEAEQRNRVKTRHLAQGAPTSPALSNLAMYNLDKRLDGLAKSLNLTYSRYADDLALSGNRHRDWRFLEPLIGSICLEEGFNLNYRKSRIVRSNQRQKITGVVVNQGVNIDRRYFDQLKAILTNCIRYGVKNQNIEQHGDPQAYLLGRIMFVNSLNTNRGQKLLSLYRQINFS